LELGSDYPTTFADCGNFRVLNWPNLYHIHFAVNYRDRKSIRMVIVMLKSAGDLIKEAQQHIECVDVATARKIYDENDDAVIVDVREADSATESKLTDSIHISRGLLEMKVHKACPEATTVILTHCGGGGRASLAAHSLQQLGYKNVYAITAPFDEIKKTFG